MFRRRRTDRAEADALFEQLLTVKRQLAEVTSGYQTVVDYAVAVERERDALRSAVADLGRRLHAAQTGPLGDTVPLPRVRSLPPGPSIDLTRPGDATELLVLPFPPSHWKQ